MTLLTWDRSYSVGIEAIDAQHNVLFEALNDLHHAMLQGRAREVIGGLLHDLLAYLRNHFAAEETLLAKNGYPDLAEHRRLHVEFADQVNDSARRFERGEIALSVQLLGFLRDWLSNHIRRYDRAYGDWMTQQSMRRSVILSARGTERISVRG